MNRGVTFVELIEPGKPERELQFWSDDFYLRLTADDKVIKAYLSGRIKIRSADVRINEFLTRVRRADDCEAFLKKYKEERKR